VKNQLNHWLELLQNRPNSGPRNQLECVATIAQQLGLHQAKQPVICVGGTNGKGTCVKALEAIYTHQGYLTGCFTSPHLTHVCERIQINNQPITPEAFVSLCQWLHATPQSDQLSWFEWLTIMALQAFQQHHVDVILLEVGMGGRCDATQCLNNDLAIITSIDLDHTEILGNTLEEIAAEKAGIINPNKPVILGMQHPQNNLLKQAKKQNSPCFINQQHFSLTTGSTQWHWKNHKGHQCQGLSKLLLPPNSLSCALQATALMQNLLPVCQKNQQQAIDSLTITGRFEQITLNNKKIIFDVAHNPAAICALKQQLDKHAPKKTIHAVAAFNLKKNYLEMIQIIRNNIDFWYLAQQTPPELTCASDLNGSIPINQQKPSNSLEQCLNQALKTCGTNDIIVIFGSFFTVGMIKRYIEASPELVTS
jgi:dihydrofolate synthase / folylpolyglutamate synthase